MAGVGGRRHIPRHVAARGDGGHQRFIQVFNGLADVGFQNPVKLKVLAGGDAHGVVAILACQLIANGILLGAEDSAGEFRAHHEHVVLRHLALVTVILLVDPMELQELVVIIGEMVRCGVTQGLGDWYQRAEGCSASTLRYGSTLTATLR